MIFKTLYGKSSKGKIKEWSLSVIQNEDETYTIKTEHGYSDGKKQIDGKIIKAGKNIGKSNETTIYEQACSDAQTAFNKKIDKGYVTDTDNIKSKSGGLFLPMLAHRYDKYSHHIKFPCWVQPKLDGVRMLAKKENGIITMWSRQGKVFEVPDKIQEELLEMLEEEQAVDGELYVHGWTFQRTVKAVKKRREDTDSLVYHIYDSPHKTLNFEDRFTEKNFSLSDSGRITFVETRICPTTYELNALEAYFISEGYEGIIVRNIGSLYKYQDRSYDLQKLKRFVDSEYKIIGGKEGIGRETGMAVFRCITEDGKEFDARPKGTREERAEMFSNLDSLIGKYLTVKYQELTEDGIPRFPVGIGIRDYE